MTDGNEHHPNMQYVMLIELAVLNLRMRIRYDDEVTLPEVHDILDSLHNIGRLIRGKDGWATPEYIAADLQRYDDRWLTRDDGATRRVGLLNLLQRVRNGDFDDL